MSFQGISIEEVLAHNTSLKKGPKGLVGVFGKFVDSPYERNVLKSFKSEEQAE
jgi:hypothetical protein